MGGGGGGEEHGGEEEDVRASAGGCVNALGTLVLHNVAVRHCEAIDGGGIAAGAKWAPALPHGRAPPAPRPSALRAQPTRRPGSLGGGGRPAHTERGRQAS